MSNPNKKISELGSILAQAKRAFTYAFIFSFCLNVAMLLLPIYSLQVLDRVISSRSIDTLIVLTIITLIVFVFYGIFTFIRSMVLGGVVEWLDAKLAPRLLHIAVLKSSLGTQVSAGQYQRDLVNIKGFVNNGVAVILDVPWSFVFVLVIYMISPVLGFLAVIGAIMLITFGVVNEFATKKLLDKGQENAIQSMVIADIASRNAEAIEAMGMMKNILASWTHHNNFGLDAQYSANKRSNLIQATSRTLRMVIQIAVTGIGAYLALRNELTVGGMIASSILVGRALAPFEGAIGMWKSFIGARDSYHRLDSALSSTPSLRGDMALPKPEGRLAAESVYYTAPNGPAILKNANFAINPGESLGIIGPSAAGKSTMAKVIMGILPPSHGSVRLDGVPTFQWNRDDFGQYVGYMPQHVDLFHGTIKDNIARMDMDAPDEAVIHAAKMAGCHEMILRLPKGYETEYTQGNMSLSPGQRQRIGLARALYKMPKFIVLDEPNGNLDGEGERALIGALARMKQAGMTYIVVAHRPSIVGNVDKILMLRDGMVEAFGPREEVLKQYTARPTNAAAKPQVAEDSVGASGENHGG